MAKIAVVTDQIPHSVTFDLGLHCLLRHVCPIAQGSIHMAKPLGLTLNPGGPGCESS